MAGSDPRVRLGVVALALFANAFAMSNPFPYAGASLHGPKPLWHEPALNLSGKPDPRFFLHVSLLCAAL